MRFPNMLLALVTILGFVAYSASAQPTSFIDHFSATSLDPAWTVQSGQGSHSLTANTGFLRYYLGGSTHPAGDAGALKIYRPFSGVNWSLEMRASFYLPYGNGRQFFFRVPLGDLSQSRVNEVQWFRTSDQAGGGPAQGEYVAVIFENGIPYHVAVPGYPVDTYVVRIQRSGQDVRVQVSPDGATWTTLLMRTFTVPLGNTQHVMLTSANFAGTGYADYDYVTLTPLREVSCSGFEAPMDRGPVQVKQNRALPLKAQLFESGLPLTDADIAAPVVQVLFDPGTGADPEVVEALPVGFATEGNLFIYADGKWQFNLSTKQYVATGTYYVSMKPGSPDYQIQPTCSAQFVKQ